MNLLSIHVKVYSVKRPIPMLKEEKRSNSTGKDLKQKFVTTHSDSKTKKKRMVGFGLNETNSNDNFLYLNFSFISISIAI